MITKETIQVPDPVVTVVRIAEAAMRKRHYLIDQAIEIKAGPLCLTNGFSKMGFEVVHPHTVHVCEVENQKNNSRSFEIWVDTVIVHNGDQPLSDIIKPIVQEAYDVRDVNNVDTHAFFGKKLQSRLVPGMKVCFLNHLVRTESRPGDRVVLQYKLATVSVRVDFEKMSQAA